METTTLHAIEAPRSLRWSCGSAKPYQREKLRTRALLNENVRGGQVQPSGWCSRFVCSTRSTSLLAHAPKVVRSLGSQQKYCVALSEKSWCDSSVCDEYTLLLLAKWLGFHLSGRAWTLLRPIGLYKSLIGTIEFSKLCTCYVYVCYLGLSPLVGLGKLRVRLDKASCATRKNT